VATHVVGTAWAASSTRTSDRLARHLTRVPSFTHATNNITYHPNGLVKVIPHLNGVTVTQSNDPNRMRARSVTLIGTE
jgi:hypothetical protein